MAYLKWEDYVVIVITLALSLGTGLFKSLRGKKDQTTTQYIMGDGKMAILPVALSLLVTYQSGIMMLGIPAEVYLYGMLYTTAMLGDFLCDLFTAQVFVPTLRRLKVTSIFQYLEIRYDSHGIRMFGTVLSILFAINYIGIVLAMPAVTLKAVAGIDIWTSIVTLIIVVLIYTLIGGFTAVIWTDVLQSILMFGGIFAVLIKGTMNAGGLTKTWRTVYDQGRINLFVFDIDPTIRLTFWNLVVGNLITNLGNPFQQTSFLRIKATPNVQTSKRMYLFAMFLAMIMRIFTGMGGAIMFAYYYSKGCDPLVSKQLDNPNQLMPAMVLDIFQETPCLPGLFLAALFCASLSTLSSILSGIMSVFWEDIVKPHTKLMSERRGIIITQLSGLIFGLIGVGIAFLVTEIKGSVIQIFMTTSACLGGAITGIFVLGFLIPWANKWGAIVGGATSVFLVAWITLGKMTSSGTRKNPTLDPAPIDSCPLLNISATSIYNNNLTTSLYDSDVTMRHGINEPHGLDVLYSLSYRWLQPIGIITVLLIGSLVSRLTGQYSVTTTVAPELVVPVFDFLCYCMPTNIRERLRCGVHYHSPNDVQENQDDGRVKDTVLDQTQST